mmetsp:Transcript_17085/g.38442  ORF Transcript_17085/g.38442 Transcript_17085/m.38442 type:complete len:398 (-) Transcript_17085:95-1288(-)
MYKNGHAEAILPPPSPGGLDDAMGGRNVLELCQLLQHVPHVHDDAILLHRNLEPPPRVLVPDLQPAGAAAGQDRDEVDVLVRGGADGPRGNVAVVVRRVVQHAKEGLRVSHTGGAGALDGDRRAADRDLAGIAAGQPSVELGRERGGAVAAHVRLDPVQQLPAQSLHLSEEIRGAVGDVSGGEPSVGEVTVVVVLDVRRPGALGLLGHRHGKVPVLRFRAEEKVLEQPLLPRFGLRQSENFRLGLFSALAQLRAAVQRVEERAPLGVQSPDQVEIDGGRREDREPRRPKAAREVLGGVRRVHVDAGDTEGVLAAAVGAGRSGIRCHRRILLERCRRVGLELGSCGNLCRRWNRSILCVLQDFCLPTFFFTWISNWKHERHNNNIKPSYSQLNMELDS